MWDRLWWSSRKVRPFFFFFPFRFLSFIFHLSSDCMYACLESHPLSMYIYIYILRWVGMVMDLFALLQELDF